MAVGITYATAKTDDYEGLTYAQFLDSLMELAFSVGSNVAGQLQAIFAAKPVPPPRPPGLAHCDSSTHARSSEPGFSPRAPPPRVSEAGGLEPPMPTSSPARSDSTQPRVSESGRLQRSGSLFRSLPSALEGAAGGSSSSSMGSILMRAPVNVDGQLRSSSAGGIAGEPLMSPRPPATLRT